jgi:Fe-S oxidoreductase
MSEAAVKTRDVMWDMPLGLEVFWYLLAGISILVFLYGVARPLAKYRRGRAEGLPSRSELPSRVWIATKTLYSHASIKRHDPSVGWAHRGIFYGWIALAIGTVIVALDHDVIGPIFGFHFFTGDFYLGFKAVLNTLGVALIAGLAFMMIRRGILRPAKLDYARPDRRPGEPQFDRHVYRLGDWAFLGILLLIALTGYLLEGVRMAMDNPGFAGFQFGGWLPAQLFDWLGLSHTALGGIRHGLWWFHGLLAIAFVAAIPYTKAAHMLASYASLILRDPMAGKRLPGIPSERATEPAGYATLADFTVGHLLELDACTKCGKCHEVCPARATGRPLSPRDVILELREEANASMSDVGIGGVLGTLVGRDQNETLDQPVVGPERVRADTIWACYQCNACVEICPVGIEQAPIINQVRRNLVEEGDLDSNLQSTFQLIHKSGNSFGENRRRRARWTKELEFEVTDARREPVDLLWFVGDYASFDPRSQRVTIALAELMHEAEVDFGILFDAERNSGNDVRRAGEEGLFESLAEQNVATLASCEFNRIVTSDPHSLNTLKNEYSAFGGEWSVSHHTSLLLELIEAGSLEIEQTLPYTVTYHDPCFLGRYNGGYDAPRQILEALGCALVEMPRNRDNSFCCGAGGGRIWIPDQPGQERPSENRIREAIALGELDYFVVSCPKDVTMYEDAIKTSGNAGRIELRELTELVHEAVAASGRGRRSRKQAANG